jgi:hypothetical protein
VRFLHWHCGGVRQLCLAIAVGILVIIVLRVLRTSRISSVAKATASSQLVLVDGRGQFVSTAVRPPGMGCFIEEFNFSIDTEHLKRHVICT